MEPLVQILDSIARGVPIKTEYAPKEEINKKSHGTLSYISVANEVAKPGQNIPPEFPPCAWTCSASC